MTVLTCGDHMMIVQFTIEADAEVPLHTHPQDGYAVPGGVTHGAIGITEVVAVDSFHPARDDHR